MLIIFFLGWIAGLASFALLRRKQMPEISEAVPEPISEPIRDSGEIFRPQFELLIRNAPILDIEKPLSLRVFFKQVAKVLSERLPYSPEDLVKKLMDREIQSSTILCPGFAVPHLIVDGEDIFFILLARSRGGIAFFGERRSRVHIVFVIVSSKDERNGHLRTLAEIAKLAQDPMFEERWLGAVDVEELRKIVLA